MSQYNLTPQLLKDQICMWEMKSHYRRNIMEQKNPKAV